MKQGIAIVAGSLLIILITVFAVIAYLTEEPRYELTWGEMLGRSIVVLILSTPGLIAIRWGWRVHTATNKRGVTLKRGEKWAAIIFGFFVLATVRAIQESGGPPLWDILVLVMGWLLLGAVVLLALLGLRVLTQRTRRWMGRHRA